MKKLEHKTFFPTKWSLRRLSLVWTRSIDRNVKEYIDSAVCAENYYKTMFVDLDYLLWILSMIKLDNWSTLEIKNDYSESYKFGENIITISCMNKN